MPLYDISSYLKTILLFQLILQILHEKIIESKYQIFILCEHTNLIDYSSDENLTIG